MPQKILTVLKSRTIQGALIALGGWLMQRHGVDPGTVAETVVESATAAGALYGVYGMRSAVKPFGFAEPVMATAPKQRRKRGPNKPKAAAITTGEQTTEAPTPLKRRSTREIVGGMEGGKANEQAQSA